MELIDEKKRFIDRLENVELKVDIIADKVDHLVEMGSVTAENVQEITDQLHDQKDYYSQMRKAMGDEVVFYRKVFIAASIVLAVFLLYIMLRI
tara:strand:+ start:148 stop:426 length:279 start_codon:yes stop_codon:yes gene_type:complete